MKTLGNASDKAEILRRLQSISPASQRRWGKMSVHNMICHLRDGFRLYESEWLRLGYLHTDHHLRQFGA